MTCDEALDWLYSTQLFGMKLGLEGPRRLLREYLAFPPRETKVIHVAGTNGKGSTCALIDSLARAAGIRTGLFTSPHLVHYSERIRVSGTEISPDELAGHLTALRALVENWDPHPTFFEITLAVAMKHFAQHRCELLVLETGLGGRLDATTAVPADVAVLTPIALDHQQWLGDSLGEIAAEKAGIICARKPTFSSPQEPEARTVIEQVANEQRSPLEFLDEPLLGYSIGIPGEHQQFNAALAVAALHALGVTLSYDVVRVGLSKARWPGRFDVTTPSPLPDHQGPLILDVAHNPAAAQALAETWRSEFESRKAVLVLGMLRSKDVIGVVRPLLPLTAEIRLVPINSPRALPPEELRRALPEGHPPASVFETVADALQELGPRSALVTGSAFLIGEVKALLAQDPRRPSAQ